MNTHWYRNYEIDCHVEKIGTGAANTWQARYGLRSDSHAEWQYVDIVLTALTVANARHKCLQHAKAEVDLLVGPDRYEPGQEQRP